MGGLGTLSQGVELVLGIDTTSEHHMLLVIAQDLVFHSGFSTSLGWFPHLCYGDNNTQEIVEWL